jgi:arabinofuranosyltransferase
MASLADPKSCPNIGEHLILRIPVRREMLGRILVPLVPLLAFLGLMVAASWLTEDSFITFRVVRNFVDGHGLRWNLTERVQSYTHPLWFFVLSAGYFLTNEILLTSLSISLALSFLAVLVLGYGIARTPLGGAVGIVALLCSKCFIEYSTSGLENPLTHLLLVLFLFCYFKVQPGKRQLFYLSLLTGLGMTNRMDLGLLFLPPLAYALWTNRCSRRSLTVLMGLSPFILWLSFSLFYYGFMFPNTAYAKLNSGLPAARLAIQGLAYFKNSLVADPVTLPTIIVAIVLTVLAMRKNSDSRAAAALIIGIGLYLAYIVKIGGCFMSGRFFSAPFLIAVGLLLHITYLRAKPLAVLLIAGLLVLGTTSVHSALRSPRGEEVRRQDAALNKDWWISDEHAVMYPQHGLFYGILTPSPDEHRWVERANQINSNKHVTAVKAITHIGLTGFLVDPEIVLVDKHALSDAFLARLPIDFWWGWAGHYPRRLPEGYLASLESGTNAIEDPFLAQYYDKMLIITTGQLVSIERFVTIILMNLGSYDSLLESSDYVQERIDRY